MSDLISRKALIKELNELRRYVPFPSSKDVFDIIMKAPAASGEPVAYMDSVGVCTISIFMVEKLKSMGNAFPIHMWPTKLYTTPQQTQSVADALEEAAKLVEGITGYTQFQTEAHYQVTYSVANKIRALIKRNAVKEGE